MTTKQRKALQQVVLAAANILRRNRRRGSISVAGPYSCLALEEAYRTLDDNTCRWGREEFSHAYWHTLMGGCPGGESLGERLGIGDHSLEALEIRLVMLALTHTLIGTGDFEAITGYNP